MRTRMRFQEKTRIALKQHVPAILFSNLVHNFSLNRDSNSGASPHVGTDPVFVRLPINLVYRPHNTFLHVWCGQTLGLSLHAG